MTHLPPSIFAQFIQQGIEKGLIQNAIKTLDGKHYLTRQYLQNVISTQVEQHGKIDVEKLAEIAQTEQSPVKDALANILENSSNSKKNWAVLDDLVVTQEYMENIKLDFEKQVEKDGYVSIASYTQSIKLPYSLIKHAVGMIENEKYIQYAQIPNTIITKEYAENCKAKIYDSLETADGPLQMFRLQKNLEVQEDLFYVLLDEIVKNRSQFTFGSLRGKKSRAVFEPSAYEEGQINLIKSIFDSNNCISFSAIENVYAFSNPFDIISSNYEEGSFLILDTCFIKSCIKDHTKQALETMKEYLDVNDILPSVLTAEDVSRVIEMIVPDIVTRQHKKLLVLKGGYVATPDYAQQLVTDSNTYLKDVLHTMRQKQHTKNQITTTVSNLSLTDDNIVKAFESLGCPCSVAEKMVPFTRKAMLNQFSDHLQTPYNQTDSIATKDQWIIDNKSRELEVLCNLGKAIYFNYRATKVFQDTAAQKSLEKYILKTQCVDYLYHSVLYLILCQSYNKAEVSAESLLLGIKVEDIESQTIVDVKQQKSVISHFVDENNHKYDKTLVLEIEALVKKKALADFISDILIKDKADLFQGESLDSEQSKSATNKIISRQLHNQLEQLQISLATVAQLLHLVTLILFQDIYRIPLYVSGKFVPMILNQLRNNKLEPELLRLLDLTHQSILNNNDRESHQKEYEELKSIGINHVL